MGEKTVKRALCLAAWAACLALCVPTCITPRRVPEALDPALVEAEIAKTKGDLVTRAEPPAEAPKEPLVAVAEPAKVPPPPRPEVPKAPALPKVETPGEPAKPRVEMPAPPKPEPPKPELPKTLTTPKPEPPKEPAQPKPEPPKEVVQPKPEPPPPPKPEPPKEVAQPKPAPPKEVAQPKPEPPKETPQPKPEPPKEVAQPKPEPPKPPDVEKPAPTVTGFVFLPSQRKVFAPGETAELTTVLVSDGDFPQATLSLSVTDAAGTSWTTTDALGPLAAGRHPLTYGIDVACFPAGIYKVNVQLGEQSLGSQEFTVAPATQPTHFRIAGWLEKPPRNERDARRWKQFLGLNTLLVQDRSAWGSDGAPFMDAALAAAGKAVASGKRAKPLEADWAAPPFVQVGDLLTGAGLEWLNACAVSGGTQRHLMPEGDLSNEALVRFAHHRIHQRMLAERRFRNFAGIHFTDEALLARGRSGDTDSPFAVAAQHAAYKKRTNTPDLAWRLGSQKWDDWYGFMMFRAGILGEALASWSAAARAVSPSLIATSQLRPPTEFADGAYPPLQARGLPVVTAQAALDGPAGMMMPAIVADLERAGNWNKPLWFMPEIADDADLDEVRAAVMLAVARKADGVVYPKNVDYHLDRPTQNQAAFDLQSGISSINETLTRLGDFLLALERPRSDVAILYSATEHIDRIGRDPVKDPQASAYPWSLIAAYDACMFAHFPATFLSEEELLAEPKVASKVVLVIGVNRMRPEVKARLEAHATRGGAVLTDTTTRVEILGARPLGVEFPDLYAYNENPPVPTAEGKEKEPEKVDPALLRRDVVVSARLIYPLLGALRAELKQHIARDYTSADPDIVVCDQQCGAGRYVFVVNNTQRSDLYRGLRWELAAAQTRVTFREGTYATYEAIAGKRLFPQRQKGHPTLTLVLPPGDLRVFALLPEPITAVRIARASHSRNGLAVSACVPSQKGLGLWGSRPINAAIPLEITVSDPAGRERMRLYRVQTPKGYEETIPLAQFEEPGTWTLAVRELLSGQKATATFRVGNTSARWASRRGPVVAFDGDRIASLLRSTEPLWIVAGTEEEAAKAESLAAALRTEQRPVEVKLAAEVNKPRSLTKEQAAEYLNAAPGNAPTPDIRQPVILLGETATHPLIEAVHNSGVVPRTVTPDYPGPGGALLCHALSAFEPDVPVVVAAASDARGVDAAIAALQAAARGRAPSTAWQALAASRAVPAAKPAQPSRVERLKVAWRYQGTDVPVAAAVPFEGGDVTVGFYDGLVMCFDGTGKEIWRRRCTTRTRAVARSIDGMWAAAASFPEVLLVTTQGRMQFAVPMEETYYRADHTAVAISVDGMLTVAGTRRGQVIGFDLQGGKVFTVGDKDLDDQKEGWQSRLGCVNSLVVAPRTNTVIAGGDNATVAMDVKGQELWASTDLNRVTCVATSLGEEQTVAVGTRAGTIACVTGGTVLWRNQAEGCVAAVCYRGDSQEVLAASLDGTLTCFDKNGKAVWTHRSPIGFRFVASSFDGNTIAAAELSGKVMLLNKAGRLIAETDPVPGAIRAFAFSLDAQRLIVGTTANNEVLVFKLKRGAQAEQDEL